MIIKFIFLVYLTQNVHSLAVYKLTEYDATPNSRVEIMNSSISDGEEFTICGRFWSPYNGSMPNIYLGLVYTPFYWAFSRLDFRDCESWYAGCTKHFIKKIPEGWTPGTSIGTHYINKKDYFFKDWKPNMWNAFCISGNAKNKTHEIHINGHQVFHFDNYEGRHMLVAGNIILLNSYTPKVQDFIYPFRGSITDVHVWNRYLTKQEVDDWTHCKGELTGNIVDWKNANLKLYGDIETEEVEKQDTCDFSLENKFVAFEQNLDFPSIVKFCENFEGEVAVAVDEETLIKMQDSLKYHLHRGVCSSIVYGGMINKDDQFRYAIGFKH